MPYVPIWVSHHCSGWKYVPEEEPVSYFVDERHNLYVGWVAGIAAKHDMPLVPVVDDDGNYTDRLRLAVGGIGPGWPSVEIFVVVPPPPADWTLEVTP